MKNYNKLLIALGLCTGLVVAGTSCSDFEEINQSPSTAGASSVKPHYFLNQSIIAAQQDPDVAERAFIYNWASAARIDGDMSFLNVGRYNDGYNANYYSQITDWLKNVTFAIKFADEAVNPTEHEVGFYANVKQFARIWRAYLISEFCDTFGSYPLEGFAGVNPEFNSVEEAYDFILSELKDAAGKIDINVTPTETEGKSDPAYSYNAQKWQKYANSLRLRYAMRLSEVNPTKAKAEFEDAAKGALITTLADMYKVKEYSGWSAWDGVYTRPWNTHALSSTMSNLLVGLGGIAVTDQRADFAQYVKPMDYMGMKFERHYSAMTDNPTKQFWLDGIPANIDPRGLKLFCLANDEQAENFIDKGSVKDHGSFAMVDESGKDLVKLDGQFTWNYYPAGERSAWSDKFNLNKVVSNILYTGPILGSNYCDSSNDRIWFAPWETDFLLAEASLYGWSTGTTAQEAYEAGVRSSFEYFKLSQFANSYLESTAYNRVGTSVKFTHTDEPASTTVNYVDGYTKEAKTMTYQYPDASKILYKGKKLNDQLTKIITQKYIAQTPYLALEMWSDHRRLGLPFFDIPANESTMTGSDMENMWQPSSYSKGQSWQMYPQRMRYPTSLKNADVKGYNQALELLGGDDNVVTPLWWTMRK